MFEICFLLLLEADSKQWCGFENVNW